MRENPGLRFYICDAYDLQCAPLVEMYSTLGLKLQGMGLNQEKKVSQLCSAMRQGVITQGCCDIQAMYNV